MVFLVPVYRINYGTKHSNNSRFIANKKNTMSHATCILSLGP